MAQKGKSVSSSTTIHLVGHCLDIKTKELSECDDSSLPANAVTTSLVGNAVASASEADTPIAEFNMVDQVIAINRSLVQQIDALRLRLQVDSRHHDATRSSAIQENEKKLKEKEMQIDELKSDLHQREEMVKNLTEENHKKRSEIQSLQHTVNALKQDVEDSKIYVDEIHNSLSILKDEKEKLESGVAYHEKEELIQQLSKEVMELKTNLGQLEKELSKAKEIISKQGSKIRLMENEKNNVHPKFKEELAKATINMRLEVEKIREEMRAQWKEMRALRKQNEGMHTDIREIKDLLLGEVGGESPGPVYNMGALKPSLPTLGRDSRRNALIKKKTLG